MRYMGHVNLVIIIETTIMIPCHFFHVGATHLKIECRSSNEWQCLKQRDIVVSLMAIRLTYPIASKK